jgi:hypothetical protein
LNGKWIYAVANGGRQEPDKRVGLFGCSTVGKSATYERARPLSVRVDGMTTRARFVLSLSSSSYCTAVAAAAVRPARMPVKYISGDVSQQLKSIWFFP